MKLPAALRRLGVSFFTRAGNSRAGNRMPLQTAALPWRRTADGDIELLLVTSRTSGKWITPKGWPMRGKTLSQAAEIEAFEEAGVRGSISSLPCGEFERLKNHRSLGPIRFLIKVHPLQVTEDLETWPERSQRRRSWFTWEAAAEAVESPELAALLREFGEAAR